MQSSAGVDKLVDGILLLNYCMKSGLISFCECLYNRRQGLCRKNNNQKYVGRGITSFIAGKNKTQGYKPILPLLSNNSRDLSSFFTLNYINSSGNTLKLLHSTASANLKCSANGMSLSLYFFVDVAEK